ncbi:MAG: glycohydrolase toxin TNT-related protein [Selenomonadaceae bacterium]|nr:glycohydrolase toxin TNT-related protein [Selenomonadaceae bacterium]
MLRKILLLMMLAMLVVSTACAKDLISASDRAKLDGWGDNRPSDELYLQFKDVFDDPLYYDQETGAVIWPANDGFAETPHDMILSVGTWLDRFGSDYGSYVAPAGISYTARACAPGTEDRPYSIFVVDTDTTVQAGSIAPWFNEAGGGYQYLLPDSVMNLINAGNLRRVEQTEFVSVDHSQPAIILQQHSTIGKILSDRISSGDRSERWLKVDRHVGALELNGEYRSGMLVGGNEHRLEGNRLEGVFFACGSTDYSSTNAVARIIDTRFGTYAGWVDGRDSAVFYADYGWQGNHLNRNVEAIRLHTVADYPCQIMEIGGEIKHEMHGYDDLIVTPYLSVQASYLRQPTYNEKIAGAFEQTISLKDNLYTEFEPGIEFKRAVNGIDYVMRLGLQYAIASGSPTIDFRFANYDRSTVETTNYEGKVRLSISLNGAGEIIKLF